jgi:hypothetical protein
VGGSNPACGQPDHQNCHKAGRDRTKTQQAAPNCIHRICERSKRTLAANCDAMAHKTFLIFSFSWIRILDDGMALFEEMHF